MPTGNYGHLGKRPSAGVQGGRPGSGEENLRAYTGLRIADAHYQFGAFITDLAANRIVSSQAIGTVGTTPRTLTRVTQTSIAAPRVNLPFPVALVGQLAAAAAPAGTHTVVVRVLGTNQFGAPATEDLTLSVAASGTSAAVLGTKIFHTISAVQVVGETNSASTDAVSVYFDVVNNPKFGLPLMIRSSADILGMIFETGAFEQLGGGYIGVQFSDFLQFTTFTVDVAESAFTLPDGYGVAAAANVPQALRVKCRTSIGMDQGARQGDKYQKNW